MTIDTLDMVLLAALVASALATVMTAKLLRSVIGLAVASAILTILMFRLHSPIAAVFELSVCAGLIPAIFISTIGLTQRFGPKAVVEARRDKLTHYWYLPILLVLVGVGLTQVHLPMNFAPPPAAADQDVRNVLWNLRHVDLFGQIIILLGGAFGVVVLLKGSKDE